MIDDMNFVVITKASITFSFKTLLVGGGKIRILTDIVVETVITVVQLKLFASLKVWRYN